VPARCGLHSPQSGQGRQCGRLPTLAAQRTLEFFTANIRNPNSRNAYAQAVAEIAAWCSENGLQALGAIEPVHVAAHVEQL
jgi:hypothetical protein